jgi:hypothetical protein
MQQPIIIMWSGIICGVKGISPGHLADLERMLQRTYTASFHALMELRGATGASGHRILVGGGAKWDTKLIDDLCPPGSRGSPTVSWQALGFWRHGSIWWLGAVVTAGGRPLTVGLVHVMSAGARDGGPSGYSHATLLHLHRQFDCRNQRGCLGASAHA